MRCNFSALFLWGLRSQQKKRKETCASTTYTSAFRIFFLTIYISWVLTSIFPVFPYQVFVNETKNILRQDQIMDYALCCQNFCFRSIFSPSNAFWMWNNFFILSILLSTLSYCLLLFLNALENCFLAQLSDLRGCIFFFPSSLLLCLLSRCIQSQYAFTLMALILILCPLAPLQLTAVTSLGESKQK